MSRNEQGADTTRAGSPIMRAAAFLAPVLFYILLVQSITSTAGDAPKGVLTVELKSKAGIVKIFLPDDISAGDTVSAAVALYPGGVTREAMDSNLGILGGYVIETSFFKISAAVNSIKFSVPRNSAGTSMKFTLRDSSMKSLATASVPIGLSSEARVGSETPTPYDYQCPLIGQAGRTVEIKGPFDGDFATTDFKIGNKKANIIAESPRKLVFESPTDVVGSVEVVLVERNVEVRRPFTCLQVLKIGEGDAVPVVNGSRTLPQDSTATTRRDERPSAGGVPERELPPATRSLEFRSIKAEDSLPPAERPAQAPSRALIPGASNEEIRIVLASQMDSASSLDGQLTKAPAVAETRPAEPAGNNAQSVKADDVISGEETLNESPIEAMPEKTVEPDSQPPVISADVPETAPVMYSGVSDDSVIEGQLLASFTGGAPDNTPAHAVDSGIRREPQKKTGGRYTVQVASYRDSRDAQELAQRLERKGYQAFVAEAEIPGKGRWYRVRVGRFGTRKEAASYGESLMRKEPSLKSAYIAEDE